MADFCIFYVVYTYKIQQLFSQYWQSKFHLLFIFYHGNVYVKNLYFTFCLSYFQIHFILFLFHFVFYRKKKSNYNHGESK